MFTQGRLNTVAYLKDNAELKEELQIKVSATEPSGRLFHPLLLLCVCWVSNTNSQKAQMLLCLFSA